MSELSLETKCIHLDRHAIATDENGAFGAQKAHYGAVSFPIFQTATFAHDMYGNSTGFDYSRVQNPTREHLEKMIANLEGGVDCVALSCGMAAISLVMELFSIGDHIIADSDLYGGATRLFDAVSAKNGLKFTRADCSKDDIDSLFLSETKAVYIESPTNPMMRVSDIRSIAQKAHAHGALLIVDNTFLTPYFQNPLSLGADIVVHSGTKYLSGHNDTLAGFVVTSIADISERLRYLFKTTGAVLSPFDSWLVLRGLKTLALRMERAEENAKKIARFLESSADVVRVIYPGLESHSGFSLMKAQSRGFGAMISFYAKSAEHARRILTSVRLIQFAESLGGVESLITYPVTQTHAEVPASLREANGITDCLLRLSVGIENAEDLISDLSSALSAAGKE